MLSNMVRGQALQDALNHVCLVHILPRAVVGGPGVLLVQSQGGRINPNLRLSRAEGQDVGSCQGHEGLLRCRREA